MTTERNYEDAYDGCAYETARDLIHVCAALWLDDLYGPWNVPVWINHREEAGIVEVGVMLTRHGYAVIHYAPATPEDVHELQALMLRVWAGRADAGFARHTYRPIEA